MQTQSRMFSCCGTCTHVCGSPRMESTLAFTVVVHTVTPALRWEMLGSDRVSFFTCSCAARDQLEERTASNFKPHLLLAQHNSRHGHFWCWRTRASGATCDRRIGHLARDHPGRVGSRRASASNTGGSARAKRLPEVLGRVRATCSNRRPVEDWELELVAILLPTLQQRPPCNRRPSY